MKREMLENNQKMINLVWGMHERFEISKEYHEEMDSKKVDDYNFYFSDKWEKVNKDAINTKRTKRIPRLGI